MTDILNTNTNVQPQSDECIAQNIENIENDGAIVQSFSVESHTIEITEENETQNMFQQLQQEINRLRNAGQNTEVNALLSFRNQMINSFCADDPDIESIKESLKSLLRQLNFLTSDEDIIIIDAGCTRRVIVHHIINLIFNVLMFLENDSINIENINTGQIQIHRGGGRGRGGSESESGSGSGSESESERKQAKAKRKRKRKRF